MSDPQEKRVDDNKTDATQKRREALVKKVRKEVRQIEKAVRGKGVQKKPYGSQY